MKMADLPTTVAVRDGRRVSQRALQRDHSVFGFRRFAPGDFQRFVKLCVQEGVNTSPEIAACLACPIGAVNRVLRRLEGKGELVRGPDAWRPHSGKAGGTTVFTWRLPKGRK